jgi:biopolymer transport protein TolR
MIKFKKEKKTLMSEINIIPFTDIVLVILIVFIIATPILVQSSIKVLLPETSLNSPAPPVQKIEIIIKANSEIFVDNTKVAGLEALRTALSSLPINKTSVVIKADKNVNYGIVANVLGVAQMLGAKKLELLVQYKDESVKN